MILIAKFVITFLLSLVMHTTIYKSPSDGYQADGSPIGICDAQKRDVLAPNFSRIDYAGHGLFVAWSINKQNRYKHGDELTVMTYDGKPCQIKMPVGGTLFRIFWLGKDVDQHPDTLLTEMPPDALFTFERGGQFGLCDAQGNVILEPTYGSIGHAYEGKAFVTLSQPPRWGDTQTRGHLFLFDCNMRKLTDLGVHYLERSSSTNFNEGLAVLGGADGKYGFIDATGKFVIEPKYFGAAGFSDGLASVVTSKPEGIASWGESNVIDKAGHTVSPANLSVGAFMGDLAAARRLSDDPPLFGLVDRKFRWVIKPCYATLWTENQPFTGYTDKAYTNNMIKNGSAFWVVMKKQNEVREYLSMTGKKIGETRTGLTMDGIQEPNVLRWRTGINDKFIYTDMNGNALPNSYTKTLTPPSAPPYQNYPTFRMIAPDRFLKTVHSDSGHFDREYWESQKNTPIARLSMFGRFLADFNLIGMPETKVIELLGKPRSIDGFADRSSGDVCHDFSISEWCYPNLAIRVYFLGGKVRAWCFIDGKGFSDSIEHNVLLKDGSDEERAKNPFAFIMDKPVK